MAIHWEEPLPRNYDLFVADSPQREADAILRVSDGEIQPSADARQVATGFNDLGESRLFFDGSRYTIGISPCPGVEMRYMRFSEDFRQAHLSLRPGSVWNPFIIDSMLRIYFSQVAALENAFLIHASAVETGEGARLFLGKSGTGKSTHAALWLKNFPECRLLNDDNPLVRLDREGTPIAYGTPWSGKTRCWVRSSAPLLSLTRIRQAPENAYTGLRDVEAFVAVLPGVSVISHSRELSGKAYDTLGRVVEMTRVGILDCRPDREAAIVCRCALEEICV